MNHQPATPHAPDGAVAQGPADADRIPARDHRRTLLLSRSFAPLFWCQLLAAFGDNLLRNALGLLALWMPAGGGHGWMVAAAAGAFVAPSILFSGLGGDLADSRDKAMLARRLKAAEIPVAVLALVALGLGSVPLLFACLVAAGLLSALFGPVKYGILPDRLAASRLPGANALIEAATFAAILAGAVASGAMLGGMVPGSAGQMQLPARVAVGIVLVAVSLAAWGFARLIPRATASAPSLRIRFELIGSTVSLLRGLGHGPMRRAAFANAWFWMVGSAALSLMPGLVHARPDGSPGLVSLCLCVFAGGIAAGSGMASFLSGGRIVLLLAVPGAALTGLSLIDLGHASGLAGVVPSRLHLLADLFLAAVGGGLMAVPTLAAVQAYAEPTRRARSVAGQNVVAACGMALTAAFLIAAQKVGFAEPSLLAISGAASLVAGGVMLWRLSPNPAGELVWLLFRLFYRVEVRGAENLPQRRVDGGGPAVIVTPNHVSWLDACLLFAVMDRPLFAIDGGVSRLWWVRPFLRVVDAVPVDAAHPLSMRRIIEAIRGGRPTVIFPEGRITVTGSIMRVQDGAAMAADKAGALIVPARIEGLQATMFSRLTRTQVRRRLFPKVRLTVLPAQTLALRADLAGRRRREAAGRALQDVLSDMQFATTDTGMTLFEAVALAARTHGMGRVAVQDPVRGRLSYRKLLAGAAVLGTRLAPYATPERRIGLMLPNANAAAASVLGLASAGIVPVLLNPRGGLAALRAAIDATGFTTLATSRRLVEKARIGPVMDALSAHVAILYLEDLPIGFGDRVRGLLRGRRPLVRGVDPDGPAVVMMTSGTSGVPKGVVLSHRNILANIAQVASRIDFGPADTVLNVLPVFHAFGLTGGMMLPLVHGVPVFLYPSPLDYRTIPVVASAIGATALFGTNSFLSGYARTAHPTDFRTVRLVVAGAEPVTGWTRRIWNEKFGLRILEGYGITEAAPVLAVNTPLSNRDGTVGRLLPGLAVKLVPVEGVPDAGRLHVSGPNVMLGYLLPDAPGHLQPPREGWHDTGDIVSISGADGHVTIRGRAARFAKVAGEMVSLAQIERVAGDLWPDAVSVAVALADPRKGERILLLTDRPDATRSEFLKQARLAHLPDVALPAELRVTPSLPLLGSGKPDILAATKLAAAGGLGERVG
ncbi:AMP-binding protein [Lichenicola sp.]|uniref:AMP-binding protein n=1 Tax=Lichenicola sp. TaxID=2804529 RepID=UPI003B00DB0A